MSLSLSLVISLLTVIVIFFLLYKLNIKKLSKQWALLLSVLRSLALGLIVLLLLNPIWITKTYDEIKPKLSVIVDNSTSILNTYKDTVSYIQMIEKLETTLRHKYNVELHELSGNTIDDLSNINWIHSSDLSSVFQHISNATQNESNAYLFISDGIRNVGNSPQSVLSNFKKPIHTLLVGDTTTPIDAYVSSVMVNKMVSLHAKFEMFADVVVNKFGGKNINVELWHKGNIIAKTVRDINSTNSFLSIPFVIEAKAAGLQKYTVKVQPIENEINLKNNEYDVYIDVVDESSDVVIYSPSVHPDVGVIQGILKDLPQFQVAIVKDIKSQQLAKADIVIVHNPNVNDVRALSAFNKPIWYILGAGTHPGIYSILGLQQQIQQISNIEYWAILNEQFNQFQVSDNATSVLSKLPPLLGAYNEVSNVSSVLLYQKIGAVNTQKPLWFFVDKVTSRNAFLLGEGIWKWKLYEFKNNKNINFLTSAVKQTLLYIRDIDKSKKFTLYANKHHYNVFDNVILNATLKDEIGALVNTPIVAYKIIADDTIYSQGELDQVANVYRSDLGPMESGGYTVQAYTDFNTTHYTATARFEVEDIDLERYRLHADFNTMYHIASATGGESYFVEHVNDLVQKLLTSDQAVSVLKEKVKTNKLIDYKFIFFLIIAFMSLEWFLRKWNNI